jgi:hypothetical protein
VTKYRLYFKRSIESGLEILKSSARFRLGAQASGSAGIPACHGMAGIPCLPSEPRHPCPDLKERYQIEPVPKTSYKVRPLNHQATGEI